MEEVEAERRLRRNARVWALVCLALAAVAAAIGVLFFWGSFAWF